MGKYLAWVLKEQKLAPLGNVTTVNEKGYILRHIRNVYECPYCHRTYECILTNKFDIRKCRWCNHSVSPYKGDTTCEIWLPKGAETLD